jgi:hypothetical protein
MLPKLNNLTLEVMDEEDATTLPWPKPSHGFATLRRLTPVGESTHQAWAIGSINNARSLTTNLNELVLHNSALFYHNEGTKSCKQSRSFSVTKLELFNTEMHPSDIQSLIKICPDLETLHCSSLSKQFSYARLMIASLAPLIHNLEELYLDLGPEA